MCGSLRRPANKDRLEFITACLARPGMPHAAFVEIFGSSGGEQPIAALRATILAVRPKVRLRHYLSTQIHDVATPVGMSIQTHLLLDSLPKSILLQLQNSSVACAITRARIGLCHRSRARSASGQLRRIGQAASDFRICEPLKALRLIFISFCRFDTR